MEEMMDFDEWLANYKQPEIQYFAVYNPDTGQVTAVGPGHAFSAEEHKIPVEQEVAELVLEGKISIHSCFVDTQGTSLEIAETKSMFKIDDVLHRIISKEWTEIEKPDVYLTYERNKKTLRFELTEEFHGTYKQAEKYQPVKQRKVNWSGDTQMNFLITDYNDPNVFYKMITITVNDLIGKSKNVRGLELPEKFSVYTRRIFKNYVIEIK